MDNYSNIYLAVFFIITFLWVIEIIKFRPEVADGQSKKTFYQILFSIVSSIVLTSVFFFSDTFSVPSSLRPFFINIGIIGYAIGIFVRLWSRFELGKYFSHHVAVDVEQELISKGPYKYFRHPLYIGLFLLTVSVPVFTFNYGGLIYALLSMKYSLSQRINEEELEMEKVLGQRYIDWKKDRYKIF